MSTEQERERLSAFMDGEASPFESAAVARDLRRDPDLAACWERWHLIGRGLRAEPNAFDARQVAVGVRAALETGGAHGDGARALSDGASLSRGPRFNRPIAAALAAGLLVVGIATLVRSPLSVRPADPPLTDTLASADARWQQRDPEVRARLDRLLVTHQERLSGAGGIAAYAAVVGYEAGP